MVGVDRYSDFPEAARALPQVGADVDPSLERIVALRPDVVFTNTSANTQTTAETLERLGVPVYVSRADSLEAIFGDIATVGEVTGHRAQATALASEMRARLAKVARGGAPRVGALVVVWTQPLTVAGPASHVGDLLHAAGGENVVGPSSAPFPTYSLERMLAHPPSVAIVGTYPSGAPPLDPLAKLAAALGARAFPVVTIDGDLIFRPGPRVVDGVEALDRLLHPPVPK